MKIMLQKNLEKLTLLLLVVPVISWNGAALAHAPLFMMAPEAPGKGAFDLHTSLVHSRHGGERRTESELEFTYGLSRDFALGFGVLFSREEHFEDGMGQSAASGIDNPDIFSQWRFWDRDTLGAKYSSAIRLGVTAPVGDKSVERNKPTIAGGIAYGMESIKWYYVFDARYRFDVEDDNTKSGDLFFADFAVGLRPQLGGIEDTDTVLFLEFNYMNERRAKANGVDNLDSGGDFLFISPEILISPNNRTMIRTGVQIPVYQELNGVQKPKDITFKFVLELRY